jgi:hypothetical protein
LLKIIFNLIYFTSDEDSNSHSSMPGSRTGTPEPNKAFRDKKEAMEAFKEFLKEKVR